MNQDIAAYAVVVAFVVFVVGPLIEVRSGEPYWKCWLMGNAVILMVIVASGAVHAMFWAVNHLAGAA